jgi:elongation factor 1-beta
MPSMMPSLYPVFGHVVVKQSAHLEAVKMLKVKLKALDTHLEGKQFLVGSTMTVADVVLAVSLSIAFQTVLDAGFRKAMPHLTAWFTLCTQHSAFQGRLGAIKMAEKAMKAFDPNAADEEEGDDMDLFGDDDEGDAEAAKKAAAAAKEGAKKKKKEVIAMSLVMLDVKPSDDEVDLDKLAQRLFTEITQEGLFWKTEYKKEPVAFGIFKLIVGFSLEDEKVSVDEVVERIEALEDMVQSVEITAFNKI